MRNKSKQIAFEGMMLGVWVLCASLAAAQETVAVELALDGPNCKDCKQDIERGLKRVDGFVSAVAQVDVEKKKGTAALQISEKTAVNREAIVRSLRQFTVTQVKVTVQGEITSVSGSSLDFRAAGSGQGIAVTKGSEKDEAAAFDGLRRDGAGKYQLSGELIATPGGGQALRLKSYQKSK